MGPVDLFAGGSLYGTGPYIMLYDDGRYILMTSKSFLVFHDKIL